jgi:uncharacterized protein
LSTLTFSPKDINLKIRTLHQEADVNWLSRWFYPDDVVSHFANVVSTDLETVEGYIVTAVQRAQPHIKCQRLSQQIDIFLQQEQAHSELHHAYNRFLVDAGYVHVVNAHQRRQRDYAELASSSKPEDYEYLLRQVCYLEHVASSVGRVFLQLIPRFLQQLHAPTAYLFAHHAVEELEHKGVCFDCYQHIFQRPPNHTAAQRQDWLQFSTQFKAMCVRAVKYFLHMDRVYQQMPTPSDDTVAEELFGVGGLLPTGGDYYRFIEPGFHPWDIDDRGLIQRWDQIAAMRFHSPSL